MIALSPVAGRMLRWVGFVAGSLVLFAFVFVAAMFALNWRDESLTPQARALLVAPANPYPPGDNIYLAMAGITVVPAR